MASPRPRVKPYEGGNETIDRLLAEHWPDDTIWMVNGPQGRKPIINAETGEEAIEIYVQRYEPQSDEEDDLLVPPA